MPLLLPDTGRTAHALSWRKRERKKKQQSDAASQAASEVTVASSEVGAGEGGGWQSEISQRGRKKRAGVSRPETKMIWEKQSTREISLPLPPPQI